MTPIPVSLGRPTSRFNGPARMTSRRTFIRTLGLGVLAVHRHAHAQASAKAPRVGYSRPPGQSTGLRGRSFRALGYVIGENVLVDARAPQQNTIEEYSALASSSSPRASMSSSLPTRKRWRS